MHFITFFTALIAFTSTTSAGTLHDRRRDNRFQIMRRNRGPILKARHNGQHPGGVEAPVSSALSTSDAIITTTTALEGLNSTTGLDATVTTAILESTSSEIILTSKTAAINVTACPPAVTVTITSAITVDAPGATTSVAPKIPDANENVVSMISVITLTKSGEPFITTTDIDGVPALTSVTPAPELVLSTITLGPGGATETSRGGAAAGETGGGRGKGMGKGRKNKKEGGNGMNRGGGSDEEEDDDNDEAGGEYGMDD